MDDDAEVEPKVEIQTAQKQPYRVVEDDSKPPLSDLFFGDGSASAEVVMLRLPPSAARKEN